MSGNYLIEIGTARSNSLANIFFPEKSQRENSLRFASKGHGVQMDSVDFSDLNLLDFCYLGMG